MADEATALLGPASRDGYRCNAGAMLLDPSCDGYLCIDGA